MQRIQKIRSWADELESVQYKTNVASLTGASAGIVGGGLGIAGVGMALAPLTFGASAVFGLTVAGAVVGGAGATTGIASMVTKNKYEKSAKKRASRMLESYKDEVAHMKTVQDKFEEICLKEVDHLENARMHGNQDWGTRSPQELSTMVYYVSKLEQINKSITCMLDGNNIVKKTDAGDNVINMNEIVAMEELLDHYDSVSVKIHALMEGTEHAYATIPPEIDDDMSDFYIVDVMADGIPTNIGTSGAKVRWWSVLKNGNNSWYFTVLNFDNIIICQE